MANYKSMHSFKKNHIQNLSGLKLSAILFMVLTVPFWLAAEGPAQANDKPAAFSDLTFFNEGTIVPPFTLERLTGGRITLSDLRGKIVLIDFWATW